CGPRHLRVRADRAAVRGKRLCFGDSGDLFAFVLAGALLEDLAKRDEEVEARITELDVGPGEEERLVVKRLEDVEDRRRLRVRSDVDDGLRGGEKPPRKTVHCASAASSHARNDDNDPSMASASDRDRALPPRLAR